MIKEPTTPGEILQEDFLNHYKLSRKNLAEHLNWDIKKIDRICNDESSITPQIALALAAAFGTSAEFWVNMQKTRDLLAAQQNFRAVKRLPCCVKISKQPIKVEKIKVEKNIPIHHVNLGPRLKFTQRFPFKSMEVNDSFFIKCEKDPKKRRVFRATLSYSFVKFNKSSKYKIKITSRSYPEGFRVWRIE